MEISEIKKESRLTIATLKELNRDPEVAADCVSKNGRSRRTSDL